jgi:hypothetical protein
MHAATIPWGALLAESVIMFVVLLGLGLCFIGIWALWSHGYR